MKYRIKITTYKNGRKEYTPQVKRFIGWAGLGAYGDSSYFYDTAYNSRKNAFKPIYLHSQRNQRTLKIRFEYFKICTQQNPS